MNIYIDIFSMTIFTMSIYILYARIRSNSNVQSYILGGLLSLVVLSKLLYIIESDKFVYLKYINLIIMLLIVCEAKLQKHLCQRYKILISIVNIVSFVVIASNIFLDNKTYFTILLGVISLTTINIINLRVHQKKLNKIERYIISFILINLVTSSFIKNTTIYYQLQSILYLTLSIYTCVIVFNRYVIDIYIEKQEIIQKLKYTKNSMNKFKTTLKLDESISNKIKYSLNKKKELLQVIIGENKKCTFVIDNEGYILDEGENLKCIFKNIDKKNDRLKFKDFMDENIKNSEIFIKNISKVRNEKIELTFEVKSKDDKIFNCMVAPFAINNKNKGVICIMNDITYHKVTSTKINENNIKYKTIVKNIPYLVFVKDDENILYKNNNQLNIDEDGIESIVFSDCINGDMHYYNKDGSNIYMHINRINFDDEGQKTLISIKDITQHKKLLEELKYSEIQYETLVNLIPQAIYMRDYKSKKIDYSNKLFSDLVTNKDLEILNEFDENSIINLGSIKQEIRFKRKNLVDKYGTIKTLEWGEHLVKVDGQLKKIGVIRDITQQVESEKIEREIEVKKKEHEIKREFFINISHELKTPLNLITSSNQLLDAINKKNSFKTSNNYLDASIETVKKNTDMLMGLIDNIIDLAKLESDFYHIDKDYYNIVSVIEDICYELNKYIEVNDIEILFDTDEEEQVVNIDIKDIERIVITLLCMVIRYSNKKSTILVNLENRHNCTKITIKNNKGYNYSKYRDDKSRKNLDIAINIAENIINLYNAKMDIEIDNSNSISVNITINTEKDMYSYKERVRLDNSIYAEYMRMSNF